MSRSKVEPCPLCGSGASVQPKVLLIDEAWADKSGIDPRLKYLADLRVDDLNPGAIRGEPLSQFVDGYFCGSCGKAYVASSALKDSHRRYK